MVDIDVALQARAFCGECPIWDDRDNSLAWIDVHAQEVHRWNAATGRDEAWPLPEKPGSIALRRSGGVLVALEHGVHAADQFGAALTRAFDPEPDQPGNRFNDGRCDSHGRFWVGSLPKALDRPAGALYRCDPQGAVTRGRQGLIVPNGMAFSPAGDRMYFADSRARIIWCCDYDADSGTPRNERVFAVFDEDEGRPDGAAVDEDGCYWIAHVLGGRISRFTPDGRRDRMIPLPVTRPTMCAFGGCDRATMFVTTGTEHLSERELAEQPLAGCILALRVGVAGLAEPYFEG